MSVGSFAVWNSAIPSEFAAWRDQWETSPTQEPFVHPAYVERFRNEGELSLCAAWRSESGNVLYPFIYRPLRNVPWCPPGDREAADITTPYGYGGPFFWGSDRVGIQARFQETFDRWAAERRVVSEFVRFSLFGEELLEFPGEVEAKQDNIVCDLSPSEEEIWSGFEHKVRKNVKKAQRSGISIVHEQGCGRLDDFLRIYHGTMARRSSSLSYYFPGSFFERIAAGLNDRAEFFYAFSDGRVVSCELVLRSRESAYSFLGGTDPGFFECRPNDLLKYEIILWARRAGLRHFVLGGGFRPMDGIFRYKASFAPEGARPFRVGRRILDPSLYRRLLEGRVEHENAKGAPWLPAPGFFPEYRA